MSGSGSTLSAGEFRMLSKYSLLVIKGNFLMLRKRRSCLGAGLISQLRIFISLTVWDGIFENSIVSQRSYRGFAECWFAPVSARIQSITSRMGFEQSEIPIQNEEHCSSALFQTNVEFWCKGDKHLQKATQCSPGEASATARWWGRGVEREPVNLVALGLNTTPHGFLRSFYVCIAAGSLSLAQR